MNPLKAVHLAIFFLSHLIDGEREFLNERSASLRCGHHEHSELTLLEKKENFLVCTPFFFFTVPIYFVLYPSHLLSPPPLTHSNPHESRSADPVGMSRWVWFRVYWFKWVWFRVCRFMGKENQGRKHASVHVLGKKIRVILSLKIANL